MQWQIMDAEGGSEQGMSRILHLPAHLPLQLPAFSYLGSFVSEATIISHDVQYLLIEFVQSPFELC